VLSRSKGPFPLARFRARDGVELQMDVSLRRKIIHRAINVAQSPARKREQKTRVETTLKEENDP
jgi:hypothetical protein